MNLRIDLFLYRIRLLKSRTLVQAMIEKGTTRVDGKRVERPSEPVRIGSVVAMALHGRVRVIRVLALPQRRGPAGEARLAYEEIDGTGAAT